MVAFFDDVDLLLSPVTTGPPLPARPWHERSFLANVTASARWAPWTGAWNLAGLPAVVLPAGMRPEGLPVAVQFVGPPGAESRLLWIAGELERRQPWRRYAPVFDPTASPVPAPV
jgi:amidase